ncbi:MAG: HAMP domain-containing sensor histidine kinase [Bacteroidota bacterium]
MQKSTSTYLVLAAAIAMAILIAFQVTWIRHSQQLIQEQFNTNVSKALNSTVDELALDDRCRKPFNENCAISTVQCAQILDTLIKTNVFVKTLSKSLASVSIDLPYEAKVAAKTPSYGLNTQAQLPPYSCSLDPITKTDSHFLKLEFSDQRRYILDQMGIMTGASFSILILICCLFFYASYLMLRQQKMSDLNREFFNHMAHEFRTPLTNIKLAGSLLARKQAVSTTQPHLQIIQKEANHLMHQVEQVLYLARIEERDYLLRKEECELVGLIRETLVDMQLQIAQKQAHISFTPSHTYTEVLVDRLHLRNALCNLLDNALKHNANQVHIHLSLREYADHIEISIADDGKGMDDTQLKRIFVPFHRLKESQQSCKGFGLGLAYVKRVIDLHGGRIDAFSERTEGIRFEISIPK